MENISPTKKEVTANHPMMKHTKIQLVEMIEDMQRHINDANFKVQALEDVNADLNENLKQLDIVHQELKADYEKECDENMSMYCEYKNNTKKWKTACGILCVLSLIAICI